MNGYISVKRVRISSLFAAGLAALIALPAQAQFGGGFSPAITSTQNIANAISGNVAAIFNARMKVNDQVALKIERAALADNGAQLLLIASDGTRSLWDMQTGRELRRLKSDAALPDGLAKAKPGSSLALGEITLNVKDGVAMLDGQGRNNNLGRLVLAKDGWAVVAETGLFDSEGDGIEAVKWTAKDLSFDLDQFSNQYYEPGLLARLSRVPLKVAEPPVQQAAAPAAAPAAAAQPKPEAKPEPVLVELPPPPPPLAPKVVVSKEFAMPPKASFAALKGDSDSDKEEFDVAYEAENLGGGVEEIRLFQNGKLVHADAVKKAKDSSGAAKGSFKARLANGQNEFRLVALSADRIESRPVKAKVNYTGAEKKSRLHVLTIGVNQYRNPALNLNYAVEDATAIADYFRKQPTTIYREVVVQTLFDQQATKANIQAALTKLAESNPEDMVLLYFAGHGDTFGDSWYFMPHEVRYPEREDEVKSRGLATAEINDLVKNMGAQKVLMMMDACKSGAALVKYRGFEDRKALMKVARASGVHVVAAAGKDQFAAEVSELGHGIFTYTLLEALSGKASRKDQNYVTVRSLTNYIEDQLPEISQAHKGVSQFPVVDSRGMDFPVAVF